MTAFLTFHLAAPLASFGGLAVGERRASDDRPAKSAILGLVAGALGVERDHADAHTALGDELFYAVRSEDMKVRAPRRLMTDYHTAQSRQRARNQRFATRREEVRDKRSLDTILSYREYRTDCSFTIALWARAASLRFTLEKLEEALRKPLFVPYFGRKACPLMLPMQPLIVDAADVREAFVTRDRICADRTEFLKKYELSAVPRALGCDADAGGDRGERRERRRDQIHDRKRWQFGTREEIIGRWEGRST